MRKKPSNHSDAIVSIFLILGILVIGVGIYLIATDNTATGISMGGKGSPRGGTIGRIRGEFILAGGIVFTAFPAFVILKRIWRKL